MKRWLAILLVPLTPCSADLIAWRLTYFPDSVGDPTKESTIWGNHADPDNDAYTNVQEYLRGSDPTAPSDPVAGSILAHQGDHYLALTFPHRLDTDPAWATVIETSPNAEDWTQASILAPSLNVPVTGQSRIVERIPQGLTELVTVRANTAISNTERLFMRTRAVPEAVVLPPLPPAAPFAINDGMLTDPLLQHPKSNSVSVVWYTSFEGSAHRLVHGDSLNQEASATTTKLSRMLEDERSELPTGVAAQLEPATAAGVRTRNVWRHEAVATGLTPGRRQAYFVESVNGSGQRFRSMAYSLQPTPPTGQGMKILLTSDQQNRPLSAANYEKIAQVAGPLDAILFAGDFVDYPNRASEWFDRANASRPAFFPAMQGRLGQLHPESTYMGGALLQQAPILGILGNHEVSGRWFPEQNDIQTMYNDTQPRWYAELRYGDYLEDGNPSDSNYVRNHSHEMISYQEMWPTPSGTHLPYWSYQYGDIFVIGLHINRIWRLWGNNRKGKESEATASINDPDTWGFGDHFLEDFGPGSAQYDWLIDTLASPAFQASKHQVVLAHQTVFGLGDNAYPVLDPPEASISYDLGNGVETLQVTYPMSESQWDTLIAPLLGSINSISYDYETSGDLWKQAIEPLLLNAGVDLVFCGHSHLWNRSKVGSMHYLESSNVGNTFGARYADAAGDKKWPTGAFPPGDPHGRTIIPPSHFNPMQAWEGYSNPLPFVSSNVLTVFSILDTSDSTVKSYVFDTRVPSSSPVLMDTFTITGSP